MARPFRDDLDRLAAFSGMRSDPALAAAMQQVLHRDQAAMAQQALGGAIERGEPLVLGAAALFADVAPAVVVHRALFSGQPCDAAFVEHVVDDVLLPLLRSTTTPSP